MDSEVDSTGRRRRIPLASKANRQLVKRNPPSSSGGIDLRIHLPDTFTPNASKLNNQ
ncbi:unnamed protein product [Protopolystoma xenopodis]|uniref:Uncharacterized protein n=1 Tax=Protopolystoma xenopodis TaxID=117903 RepID=A0A448WE80_9PLAT|nr:unnamed protein product [Protopolystoma xenopodis]